MKLTMKRRGGLRDLRWEARKPYALDTVAYIWEPLRTNPTHTLGWTTRVRYFGPKIFFDRRTYLMGSGKKRMRMTGKKRTYEEAYITLTPTGGQPKMHRLVNGKVAFSLTTAAPIQTDLTEWFGELKAKVEGCYAGGEFAPLWDWLIESSPIAAEYLDSPGWLPTRKASERVRSRSLAQRG